MTDNQYRRVIEANIVLHSKMSEKYNTCEPHFRPENIKNVEANLVAAISQGGSNRLLDLGCGTGFMINIAKKYVAEIHGIDVTRAMLDKVDTSGTCLIKLFEAESGAFPVEEQTYNVVTSYSFLHHLYDITPTLTTAYRALKSGGVFYADLDPNYYFWKDVNALDRDRIYDPIVKREIEAVHYKDEDIERNFGVPKEVFNQAEYGKNVAGGFKEDDLKKKLGDVGFKGVIFFYHWFLGQGMLINDVAYAQEDRFKYAEIMNNMLQKALPVSRNLFKYIGFLATK
jgi:ubiquinone/menaquinone biosynthesis C-methylase UbiE